MKEQASNHVSNKQSESDGAPAKAAGAVSGEFVTETFEYEGRQVTVYVPPNPPQAIVFAGDGQRISKWGRLLEKADVPSTMIVGVHGLTDEKLRLHEYSPGFEPERFAAHEKFFVEDVRRWTESRFGVALPRNVPQCSASRRVESWPSLLGFGIHMSTVRSSAPRLEAVTSRLALSRARFRVHTLSLALRSRSSWRTQRNGRTRCAMQVRMSL
ncbi:MAG: hypothetical protein WB729_02205 [Candidatus Sulfotelmatobacter sp.]